MYILGIETSCDNTAFAIFDTNMMKFPISLNLDQSDYVTKYGYVPTELSRLHAHSIGVIFSDTVLIDYIKKSDYIAVTAGPGLMMSLYIGVSVARFLSLLYKKKIFFVDHIEAHMLSCKLDSITPSKFLSIVLSGGHCIFSIVSDIGNYKVVAYTIDDAVGEVFDKVARALNLVPVSGSALEKCAANGRVVDSLVDININIRQHNGIYELSFSGIKSHFIRKINSGIYNIEDVAHSFQYCIFNYIMKVVMLVVKCVEVGNTVCFGGGVCSNKYFRYLVYSVMSNFNIVFTRSDLCCDNAEMICWAAFEYYRKFGTLKIGRTVLCSDSIPYDKFDYDKIR